MKNRTPQNYLPWKTLSLKMAKSMKKVHIYRRNTALGALNTINIFVFIVNRRINIRTVKNLSYYLYATDSTKHHLKTGTLALS